MGFFAHEFIRHALLAGSGIAIGAGVVGWFLVLRLQAFAADALSHVAFTGALGALALGLDPQLGLLLLVVVVALGLAALGDRARADDVVVGSVFAWLLGLATLFLSVYATRRETGNGLVSITYLFGSIFGLDLAHTWTAAGLGLGAAALVLAVARPLLFASVDPPAAAGRGVPVRALGAAVLVLAGLTTAAGTQSVGALLMLGLLTAPAGAAHRVTGRPYLGIALSALIALASVWVGIALSYLVADVPPSFGIVGTAGTVFALAGTADVVRRRLAR